MIPFDLPPISKDVQGLFKQLTGSETIRAALLKIEEEQEQTLQDQIDITEIEAPPFHEETRAKDFARRLGEFGLSNVRIDEEGNVIGVRLGKDATAPRVVVAAHLDTVFPLGTDCKVRQEGTRYYAPGISDDARGLAVLLTVIRTLNQFNIETVGDIVFVATVGEEGNGDLRGSKYFFASNSERVDAFLSIDGADVTCLLRGSTGSRRFKAVYEGPGGHSWSNFGNPNAIHALGRAIAKIADLEPLDDPKTTFSVGTVRGGTSVNAIAAYAEAEIDMRSSNNQALNDLVEKVLPILEEAAEAENKKWGFNRENGIRLQLIPIGHRPAGEQPDTSPVLLAARGAMQSLGIPLINYTCASTDQNVPISMGIPATTLGGGGQEGNNHSIHEWFDAENAHLGPQLAFLTALSLVGVYELTSPLLPKKS